MTAETSSSTIQSETAWGLHQLASAGVDACRLEAELLLAFVLGCERTVLRAWPERTLPQDQCDRYHEVIRRRCQREPLAYITGVRPFMDMRLMVNEAVLAPRPETELLVGICTALQPERFVDAGIGSGCIAIGLLRAVRNARAIGVDISRRALSVARANATQYGVESRLTLVHSDLLRALARHSVDLVVSNPPYIPESQRETLQPEVAQWEPACALFVPGDGLRYYRRLAHEAASVLRPGGYLAVEMGDGQSDRIRGIFEQTGWRQITMQNDLAGTPRVCMAQCPGGGSR